MTTITINLSNEEHRKLTQQAKEQGMTLTEFLYRVLLPGRQNDPSINSLLVTIAKGIEGLGSGDTFSIPDFFKKSEWRQLEKGTRIILGKAFKKLVDGDKIVHIEFVKKTSSNWAVYRKTI